MRRLDEAIISLNKCAPLHLKGRIALLYKPIVEQNNIPLRSEFPLFQCHAGFQPPKD